MAAMRGPDVTSGGIKKADVAGPGDAQNEAHHAVTAKFPVAIDDEYDRRKTAPALPTSVREVTTALKVAMISEHEVGDFGVAEEDDFLREHQAADRSVEGRGDAGAGARLRPALWRDRATSLRSCAMVDPIAPPICAIGPSRPTDAPAPSEIAAPAALTKIQRRLTSAVPRLTISRKFGKP